MASAVICVMSPWTTKISPRENIDVAPEPVDSNLFRNAHRKSCRNPPESQVALLFSPNPVINSPTGLTMMVINGPQTIPNGHGRPQRSSR